MSRYDDVFHVLKVIRRTVDETHALAERAIADAAPPTTDDDRIDQLVAERARLATALERIRHAIAAADITPRTNNLGKAARGTVTAKVEA